MEDRIRILFVDDEKNVLRSLERTFLDEDYEILTASSAGEGLSVLREISPVQVVVSDYRMPDMNGINFLREVCMQWPETIRIVLSGYADTATIVSAINDGRIYKFVPKPWNDHELKITIVNAIDLYHLNKKNVELAEELKIKNGELERTNDNLERIVAEKTSKVRMQNELLMRVHNIHHAIPVGVIGIDPEGIIVQCNNEAEKLLSCNNPDLLGNRYEEKLPPEISEFVGGISCDGESMSGRFVINGKKTKVTVGFMNNCNQQGTILVIATE